MLRAADRANTKPMSSVHDPAATSCFLERRRQAAELEDDGRFVVVIAQLSIA